MRAIFPNLPGPRDVTPELAHQFKNKFLGGTFVRGKASDAKRHPRSPMSCTTYLRPLRALWSKHFGPLGYVTSNPWSVVPFLNAPRGKRVRVPSDETIAAFFQWLRGRYPGWSLPVLFVQVKMVAGAARSTCARPGPKTLAPTA